MEGHSHSLDEVERQAPEQEVLLALSQAYYGQWQRFPKPAGKWQRGEDLVFHEGRLTALKHIVESAHSVLDVGCGIGLDHQPLSNISYYGVDVTPRFVKEARRLHVPCQVSSALHLPFRDESFDIVYCRNLLLHLPPDQVCQALDEMLRVASKEVVTVEPAWEHRSNLSIRELIDTDPSDMLMFFSNAYSEREMVEYARSRKAALTRWFGHDSPRSAFLHRNVDWQVTVYSKEAK